MPYNRDHQRNIDNQCDCCNGDESRAELIYALREAIRCDPSFIGEAIGDSDTTDLVAAYLARDGQRILDFISDAADAWLAKSEEWAYSGMGKYPRATNDLEALKRLADVFEVTP